MSPSPLQIALSAARSAGQLLRENFGSGLSVNSFEPHDIKLELDVRTQALITGFILEAFPDHAVLGEEGNAGTSGSPSEWIVDPIDGTVNYFYGIPHFCVSIALRTAGQIQVGVIYDPMRDELWQAQRGSPPLLNGRPFQVSRRSSLEDAVVSVGMSKDQAGAPLLLSYAKRVRKCRLMGSAALDMAYVACGRLDAYIERSISLWDVAAGVLLVESAGGKVNLEPHPTAPGKLSIIAGNGLIDLSFE